MKKFFKILGIVVVSILGILYLSFLFILPNAINLNNYKSDIQKITKEQTNLNLDFNNAKIAVTPWLETGISASDIKITLPDNSDVLTANSLKARISLPFLLAKTFRISTVEVKNPTIKIDIADGKYFKAVQAFEEILNNKEETIEENIKSTERPLIDPEEFKIVIPGIKIYEYQAYINDLKTGDFLKLCGDKLTLGYNNGEIISLKTLAELYLNETKNITANIDIDTIIPKQSKLDEEDDKAQRVEIPFINPVAMYMAYDLKTNADAKIKIRNKNNKIISNGYFNIDNFTLKLAGMQLPESKLHIKTRGTKADIDTDLYITNEEKINLLGMLNYGENPAFDMRITSTQINLDNVFNLIKATLDSLHIQHELAQIKGEGYFKADTYIKTDFKKIKSEGKIVINECKAINTKNNKLLARVNSVISLDNSILKFVDTIVEAAETMFKVDGTIDEKSFADISIVMEKMPLEKVFSMFLPQNINNTYTVNSGEINLDAKIKGELKKATGNLKISLNNLSLFDNINKINYLNNLLIVNFNSNFKSFTGDINNSGFKLSINGANIDCNKFNLKIGDKDIDIAPAKISINNSTNVDISGQIKDYAKNPIFNFDTKGQLVTKDLKQLLGNDMSIYIKEKGTLPISINFSGNEKKQTLFASIDADSNNYITPIDIENVLNKKTTIQTVVDFKGDRLKIKDTGFYIKSTQQDPKNPEKTIDKLDEILSIDGTITRLNTSNPNINLIKIKIPNDLNASLCIFPKSKLKANGNMLVFGDLNAPRIRGNFDFWNISIPELMVTIDKIVSKFESKNLDIDIKKLVANGSDFDILMQADLNPSNYFTINNINIMSNLTDADKLMKVSDEAMKYTSAHAAPNQNKPADNTTQADIPVIIKDGNIDIKKIKTGNITLTDTTGKLALSKNIIYINNLITSGFNGKIRGNVASNLVTSEIKAVLKGNGLDVEKTLLDAAAMKDTLTGTMDFDTNISLKGSTYEEQMKSLKGDVNFTMKNGTLGPFGKLENLIMAENIRESAFFKSTIGTILNSLLSFDTTHFNILKGHLSFNNGIAQINPIDSTGDIMSTYIFGNFDLLKNNIDIKLRGKLGSQVSDSMGPLAMLNPINLIKATPGMSLVLGKVFFLFTETVTPDELAQIPNLGKDISDNNSTKFQVVIRGDVAKPLTLVKSFKWLALESDIQAANSYINKIPANTMPIDITGSKEEIKEQVKTQAKKKLKETVESSMTDETKQSIEQSKEAVNKLKTIFGNKEELKNTLKNQAQQILTVPQTEENGN